MFLETILFDYTLASSKTWIHTFTFSPFFDDDNHYQVNYFWHHQNLHDSHSPPFWWWQPLSSKLFWYHQNLYAYFHRFILVKWEHYPCLSRVTIQCCQLIPFTDQIVCSCWTNQIKVRCFHLSKDGSYSFKKRVFGFETIFVISLKENHPYMIYLKTPFKVAIMR